MNLPSWRDWLFSAKAFLASMLALYIALAFDLPRPYWAMAAVYVVANPLAGATSSKGLYRALGTLLGASAAVFFVPIFVNAPELLSLVVALWTGCLLYISMLDRTPRSYVFMLAGYSLPLIALPEVGTPEAIFDVALARSEEIIIGITCASIVGAVVFPTSVGTALSTRISAWLDDAAGWAGEILRGEGALPATPLRRQKLAADIAGLDLVISQLSYDAATRDVIRHARELRGRLLMLLPLLSSLADRLHALKDEKQALPPDLAALLARVADWLTQGRGGEPERAEALVGDIATLRPTEPADWRALILASALDRLQEIVDLWSDCLTLKGDIERGRHAGAWRPRFRHRRVVAPARHYDYGLLLFSAGSCVLATLIACAFWIASGWANGASAVMMTAVACSFFAAMDRPAPFIRMMTFWSAVSLIVSGVYLFGILPHVHEFEMLVLVFAPPFLLLGILIPRPQFNMLAMLLAVNTASFVALQNRYGVDFALFVNEGLAAVSGLGFALVWTLVTRPFGAELAARRLVRAGWSDLAETAAGARRQDQERLAGRMLDRLGQLVPRLAAIEDRELAKVDGFAEVRVGFNILELQKVRRRLDPACRASVEAVLAGVAELYRQHMARRVLTEPSASLCAALDDALHRSAAQTGTYGRHAVDALVGLRRVFFPGTPGPAGGFAPREHGRPVLVAAE
ncbi:FUSC family protein [Ancylobacter polymorphus]|uniref:Membrane protein YccC n=1 Tax=Ancylobacter polymorphus TaxID=223390 RepID=A0ABU0BGP6_9HYPH|nr:FUSC family protein [Ancylobacter polymorphus]MDQ0305013.1 putative membrane protein YccC [Ancylobacter polymorphus]